MNFNKDMAVPHGSSASLSSGAFEHGQPNKNNTFLSSGLPLALAVHSPRPSPKTPRLSQVVETAVLNNPEVGAQFHNFQSGLEGQKVRRGALLPEVNLQGWTGREYRGSTST